LKELESFIVEEAQSLKGKRCEDVGEGDVTLV
jgi:hypothetical protein